MKEEFPDERSRQRNTLPGTLQDDVERRDFTVNMLMKDLSTGEVLDLTGTSKNDIKKVFCEDIRDLTAVLLDKARGGGGWRLFVKKSRRD